MVYKSSQIYCFRLLVLVFISMIIFTFTCYWTMFSNRLTIYSVSDDTGYSNEINRLNEAVRKQRAMLEEIACTVTHIGARGGFCLTEDEVSVGGNHVWDLQMAIEMEQSVLLGASVGDFGAGLGWYGRFWLRKSGTGILFNAEELEKSIFVDIEDVQQALVEPQKIRSWEGYDGAGNVEWITNGFIKYLDLSEPQYLGKTYEWVVSLEVGEHIPPQHEAAFLDNICSHACIGAILSWAVEGQDGHFHINNHNNSYIKDKMALRGFSFDQDLEDKLKASATLPYFKNTVMVFKSNEDSLTESCTNHHNQ